MTDLAALQAQFQAAILSPGDDGVLAVIKDSPREAAPVLFGIYRHAYSARLVEVLQGNFDKTWSLLGDEGFAAAARAYIAATPSQVRNARWYGSGFADFLARRYRKMPAVGDVAALDWAIAAAFDAPDAASCEAAAMAAFHPQQWPDLCFMLHPAVRRVAVATPAAAIYEALSAGEAPGALDPVADHTILVWREGYTVRYRALAAGEAAALDRLAAGDTFGTICEALCGFVGAETAGAEAAGLLRLWLDSEMIASIAI